MTTRADIREAFFRWCRDKTGENAAHMMRVTDHASGDEPYLVELAEKYGVRIIWPTDPRTRERLGLPPTRTPSYVELSEQENTVSTDYRGAPTRDTDTNWGGHNWWGFGPKPGSDDYPTHSARSYVEAGNATERATFLDKVSRDGMHQVLQARNSGNSVGTTFSAMDAIVRPVQPGLPPGTVPRWPNSEPIRGQDGRPLFEEDAGSKYWAERSNDGVLYTGDKARANATQWVEQQRQRNGEI